MKRYPWYFYFNLNYQICCDGTWGLLSTIKGTVTNDLSVDGGGYPKTFPQGEDYEKWYE